MCNERHGAREQAKLAAVTLVLKFVKLPARLLLENIQIISSFKRNLHVAWPNIFTVMTQKMAVVNFEFFDQPGSACSLPRPSIYDKFNVITLGLFGLIFYHASVSTIGAMNCIAIELYPIRRFLSSAVRLVGVKARSLSTKEFISHF